MKEGFYEKAIKHYGAGGTHDLNVTNYQIKQAVDSLISEPEIQTILDLEKLGGLLVSQKRNLLLANIADKLKKRTRGEELTGSKWRHSESEDFATYVIFCSDYNRYKYGDAFAWYPFSAFGCSKLLEDGSITQEDYTGKATPPKTTVKINDKIQILRVTDSLLQYVSQLPPTLYSRGLAFHL